jgi:hypothetical protein
MRRRRGLHQIPLLAWVGIGLWVVSASAASPTSFATRTSVKAHAATENGSSEAAVRRAFRALKINLVVRSAGNSSQPVTVLSAVVPTKVSHMRPWSVEVFIYPSSVLAAQAFDAGIGGWRDNGIPATRANNLIVTVVPNGREIGAYAPAYPMPELVREALRALARTTP